MELQGTVKRIGAIQTFASGFEKRELVIVTEEQYPQPISIEFLKDKTDFLDPLKEGDKVKISINIGGREWTSPQGEVKYFNSITGWRVEKLNAATEAEPTQAKPTEKPRTIEKETFEEEDDDLPF